jgi:hypothetical protein
MYVLTHTHTHLRIIHVQNNTENKHNQPSLQCRRSGDDWTAGARRHAFRRRAAAAGRDEGSVVAVSESEIR